MAKYISGDLTAKKVVVNTFSREFELSWPKNDSFFSDKVEIDLSRRLKAVRLLSPDDGPGQASPDGKLGRVGGSLFGGRSFQVSCLLLNGKKFVLEVNTEEYEKLCKYMKMNMGEEYTGAEEDLPATPETPKDAAVKEDVIDLIRKLGELKKEGLLSEEEFEGKKAELLNRI